MTGFCWYWLSWLTGPSWQEKPCHRFPSGWEWMTVSSGDKVKRMICWPQHLNFCSFFYKGRIQVVSSMCMSFPCPRENTMPEKKRVVFLLLVKERRWLKCKWPSWYNWQLWSPSDESLDRNGVEEPVAFEMRKPEGTVVGSQRACLPILIQISHV